jgi:hypothetical protein
MTRECFPGELRGSHSAMAAMLNLSAPAVAATALGVLAARGFDRRRGG